MSVINDSFNQAVDYLVQQRLNEVKFDKTVVGTLVSVPTDKDKNYKVKYENATVVAEPVDETVEYKKDDQVYLQLCADDRKLILGKQSNNENLTTKYSEPWDRLLDMTDNIYDSEENKIIIPNTNYTLYYNKPLKYIGLSVKITTIGLEDTELNADTNYVIQIKKGDETLISLNAIEMLGNPFRFDEGSIQKTIAELGNFELKENDKLTIDLIYGKDLPPNTIFLGDIYVCLGYDQEDFIDKNEIILYSTNREPDWEYTKYTTDKIDLDYKWIKYNSEIKKAELIKANESYFYYYSIGYNQREVPEEVLQGGTYWYWLEDLPFALNTQQASIKQDARFKVKLVKDNIEYQSPIIVYNLQGIAEAAGTIEVPGQTVNYSISNSGIFNIYDSLGQNLNNNENYSIQINHVDFEDKENPEVFYWFVPLENSDIYILQDESINSDNENINLWPTKETIRSWYEYDPNKNPEKVYYFKPDENDQVWTKEGKLKKDWYLLNGSKLMGEEGYSLDELRKYVLDNKTTLNIRVVENTDKNITLNTLKLYYVKKNISGEKTKTASRNFNFQLNSKKINGFANNTILFKGFKEIGRTYETSINIITGYANNNGTDYGLNIMLNDTQQYLVATDGFTNKGEDTISETILKLKAQLIDSQGNEIVDNTLEFKWGLLNDLDDQKRYIYPFSVGKYDSENSEHKWIYDDTVIPTSNTIELQYVNKGKRHPTNNTYYGDTEDYYANNFTNNLILTVETKIETSDGIYKTLKAYYPIIVVEHEQEEYYFKNKIWNIFGPLNIMYDSTGRLLTQGNNFKYRYIAYLPENEDREYIDSETKNFELSFLIRSRNKINLSDPIESTLQNDIFTPSPYYSGEKNTLYELRLVKRINGTFNTIPVFSIPLIIGQNSYFSNVIDSWDEIAKIDGNNIFSTMVVAGTKDSENKFSGVVMGELENTQTKTTEMGLFGANMGERTFSLSSEDGSAWFKKSIIIGDYNNANGYITLENGSMVIKAKDKTLVHINDSNSFVINQDFETNIEMNLETKNFQEQLYMGQNGIIIFDSMYFPFIDSYDTLNSEIHKAYIHGLKATVKEKNNYTSSEIIFGHIISPQTTETIFKEIYAATLLSKNGKLIIGNIGRDSLGHSEILLSTSLNQNNFLACGPIDYGGFSFATPTIQIVHANSNSSSINFYAKSIGEIGTHYQPSSSGTSSDINKKFQINPLENSYSIFFDNLNSVSYKYKDGESSRKHIGFIAQQVYEALKLANISTSDFAGLMIKDQNTENESWYLRYEEFIALNTYEIQKLKAQVNELENKLREKGEIKNET